jgi:hypothetical protein
VGGEGGLGRLGEVLDVAANDVEVAQHGQQVLAHGVLDELGLAGLGGGEDGVQPARFPVDASLPAGLDEQLP